MALKPNYSFERRERERLQAAKADEKARLKKEAREAASDSAKAPVQDPSPRD